MPNANYIKGVKKERKIVNSNKANGCIAFRSAGSHSPIDVCVVNLDLKSIRFYQCKPESLSISGAERIMSQMFNGHAIRELNDFFKVSFQVV